MKISVIGAGYAGLCTAVGFASKGHSVTCVDIDKSKVDAINSGVSPIYEKGLDVALKSSLKSKLLSARLHVDENSDVFFVAVQTPIKGSDINLSYVKRVTKNLTRMLRNSTNYKVIVVKSTVLPGTTEKLISVLEKSGKKVGKDFGIVVNPEFLREGTALDDFLKPERIVIGSYDKRSGDIVNEVYRKFNAPIVRTDLRTAEMVKYASNAFLAAKVSFINDIGNYCKTLGVDTYTVAEAMGHDSRIGKTFLNSGIGFGGSCLPKDTIVLANSAKKSGYKPHVLEAVLKVNESQPLRIVKLLESKTKLKGKRIAVLGLSFKADTDDVRDAPAIIIIQELVRKGARVIAYDPKSMENMKTLIGNIQYAKNVKSTLKNADACLVLTEWAEFRKLTDRDFAGMKKRIIIEGRRILDSDKVNDFEGVCW